MIGKLKKGSSFGGCIRYVTGKDEAKIIASDVVIPQKVNVYYSIIQKTNSCESITGLRMKNYPYRYNGRIIVVVSNPSY